ncbi:MAG: YraN family protein, partial [Candidatus Gastranaerophilales bacterium]|nr:YraN family protein [Candidatus Gastranaerophilales bacterium]
INAKYEISTDDRGLDISLNGEGVAFLIGYRGETLYSMQSVLSSVASKGQEDRIRVILDVEGYKAKREKTLEDLAEKMATRVVKTRKSVSFGHPFEAIDEKKIQQVKSVAQGFMHETNLKYKNCRIDGVSVLLSNPPKIEHLKNIF